MVSLVTGASGFVGSHVLDALLAEGRSVRALVRDPSAAPSLRDMGAEVMVGDVRRADVVAQAVHGADAVYHCAAAVGPAFSPREIHEVNLAGARHLLEALRRAGTGRAVLLTSVNVLGTRHLDQATEDLPSRRSHDAAADVKIEVEALAREYGEWHQVDVTVLRPGLIYGPRDRHNLPQMVRALRRGKFAFIGSRDNLAPIVHVSDVVQAMLLAGQRPACGRAYHITDGSRTSIGEFIDHLASLIGCPPPQRVLPYTVPYLGCLLFASLTRLGLYRGRPPINRSSLRHLGTSRSFSIERAARELGYVARVSYREGLQNAVGWMEEHPHEHSMVA